MRELQTLEIFEIETLNTLNKIKILDQLYFGGGTMMRLCHNLNRYSTDLDFWIKPATDPEKMYEMILDVFSKTYTVKDAEAKRNTLLFEIQSPKSRRNLKIEIRKDKVDFHWERKIAFSRFASRQVAVKGLTLEQMMENKVFAFLSRKIIRDCFDIEFLLFRGIPVKASKEEATRMHDIIEGFTLKDFKVTLGSILESNDRIFYLENQFQFLKEEIAKQLKV